MGRHLAGGFVFCCSVICGSLAASVPHLVHRTSTDAITWGPCQGVPGADAANLSCAAFPIPLDYADPSAGSGRLALIKYNATGQRQGVLFTNPGGPGGSGLSFLGDLNTTLLLSNLSGGLYDLISWDPRGVGNATVPGNIDCFDSSDAYTAFWNGSYQLTGGPEYTGNFTNQTDLDIFYSRIPLMDKLWTDVGGVCHDKHGDNLKYVGTAATVRDIVAMAEAFDGPNATVNYWGFSYGTAIGSVLVNMFPDRVGRVIIDGVLDPLYYFDLPSQLAFGEQISSSEDVLTEFLTECAQAGPDGCALASNDTQVTPMDTIQKTLVGLYTIATEKQLNISIASSAGFRGLLFTALYTPSAWQFFSAFLDIFVQLAETASKETLKKAAKMADTVTPAPSYAIDAITCGDVSNNFNITTKEVFDNVVADAQTISSIFGGRTFQGSSCHKWPFRATERYQGPWNKTLANPILVIGNLADPITPFKNAKSVADMLGDSAVLVKHNGYGHTSLGEPSECTRGIVRTYFTDGSLPNNDDTVCAIDKINNFPTTSNSTSNTPAPLLIPPNKRRFPVPNVQL